MTYIETRENASGTISYRVRWREGGRRQATAEVITCYEPVQAELVKRLVDRAHQTRPSDEVLRAMGVDVSSPNRCPSEHGRTVS